MEIISREWIINRSRTKQFLFNRWAIFRRCWYIIRTRVRKEMRNRYVLVKPLRIEKARECLVHDTEGDRYGLQPLVRAPSSQPPDSFLYLPSFTSSSSPDHSPFLWQRPSTYTFCTTLSTLILSGGRAAVNVLLTIAYFARWYTAIVSRALLVSFISITRQSRNFAILI